MLMLLQDYSSVPYRAVLIALLLQCYIWRCCGVEPIVTLIWLKVKAVIYQYIFWLVLTIRLQVYNVMISASQPAS